MSGLLKIITVEVLKPLVSVSERLRTSVARAWSHARSAAHMKSSFDPSVVVQGRVEVRGSGSLESGKGLFLYPGLYPETRGGGRIRIGDDVVISCGVHIVSCHEITIGSGSGIGEYANLRHADLNRGDGGSVRDSGHQGAPIFVGRNAWIGRGAINLPGVSVGDDAVVGANAVVTRDVASGYVVAGIAARPLRAEVAR